MRLSLLLILLWHATLVVCKDPFELPRKTKRNQALIAIHFIPTNEIQKFLQQKKSTLLSPSGKYFFEKTTNKLWIEDNALHIAKIKNFIQSLDKPRRQILIKAKLILIDQNASKQLGVYFNALNTQNNQPKTLSLPILSSNKLHLLDITIHALSQHGHASILSTPQLVTNDHQTAILESGEEIPYQEKQASGTSSVFFKKAVLRLKVTPTLLPQNKINLVLAINQDKPSELLVNGTPAITTEHLATTVTLNNRHTLMLGGIYERRQFLSKEGVPWLEKIPVIGHFFSTHHQLNNSKQLLILITPSTL